MKKIIWTHVATIKDSETGTVLYINKSNHTPYAKYSAKTGVENREGYSPFINPRIDAQETSNPSMDDSLLKLALLAQRAHNWILTDMAKDSQQTIQIRYRR